MTRLGRRPVLAAGALLGMPGLALAALAIARQQFASVCGRQWLWVGAFNAVAQYYRFVAADVAPQHGRAIAATLTGGVLAPGWAQRWPITSAETQVAVSFIVVAWRWPGCAGEPHPRRAAASGARLPGGTHARNPRLWLAVLAASSGYALMNLLMTATPLAMRCASLILPPPPR